MDEEGCVNIQGASGKWGFHLMYTLNRIMKHECKIYIVFLVDGVAFPKWIMDLLSVLGYDCHVCTTPTFVWQWILREFSTLILVFLNQIAMLVDVLYCIHFGHLFVVHSRFKLYS